MGEIRGNELADARKLTAAANDDDVVVHSILKEVIVEVMLAAKRGEAEVQITEACLSFREARRYVRGKVKDELVAKGFIWYGDQNVVSWALPNEILQADGEKKENSK